MKNVPSSLRRILYIANFVLITFVTKQAISWIPNVQVVVLLMALFAVRRSLVDIAMFMIAYVILDFMAWGYPTLMIPSFIFGFGWMTFVKYSKLNSFWLALATIPLTLFQMLAYLFHDIVLGLPIYSAPAYLIAGIPFAIPFLLSSMFSILYLFDIISRILSKIEEKFFYV